MKEAFTWEQKNLRRRKILIRNTLLAFLGYFITQAATLVARFLGATSMEYFDIAMLFSATVIVTIIFIIGIKMIKNITIKKANIVFFSQFIIWIILYGIWVLLLNEVRVIALFFGLTALLFLITNTNLIQSLAITIGACVLYINASYFGIHHLGQQGPFEMDMLYLACFLPASLYICFVAEQFNSQRGEIKEAKRNAESARDALWGEMELAKKLQTVLLPEKPSMTGYEISGYMNPADEVGGDYYDVITVDGKDWIVIGDVSGHGVPSGLVMMMTQTSIKVVLSQYPDMPPSKLLSAINSTLYHNISRLGDSRYMTITVLAAIEDGKFHYSGLHQDIMIYRSKTDNIEVIETRGMWIGIVDDLNGMLWEDTVILEKSDVMLLYTDGITEAVDSGGKMYSESKLLQVFKENGNNPVEVIRDAVLKSLEGYTCNDDVTMLILRRNGK